LIVLIGFVMILIFEQSVFLCTTDHHHSSKENDHGLHDLTAEEPLVSTCLTDELDTADDLSFRTESSTHNHNEGHHHHHHHSVDLSSSLSLRTFLLLFGLSIHSIFEGIAIGLQSDPGDFGRLIVAVLVHEVLCSFAFGVSLCQQRARPLPAVLSVVFLSACIPVGMSSAFLMTMVNQLTAIVLRFTLEGLAAGTFVYVACVEMLSAELNKAGHGRTGFLQAMMVTVGVVAFFFLSLVSIGVHKEH